ncbi:hypothetical protein CRYUN_Cryun19dG0039900 [Craigia yunnanensis]
MVFIRHSSGGAIAILATVWFLEQCLKPEKSRMSPLYLTFGSPLVADFIFNHALRRYSRSQYFLHFVMRYENIVPRILLAPLSSMERELQQVLHLRIEVSRNCDEKCISSCQLCCLSTNGKHKQKSNIDNSYIELSPYRPTGTFVFCTGNRKLVVVRNADAIFQPLFYSSQLCSENELEAVQARSLNNHFDYQSELQESLNMQNGVKLVHLEGLLFPLNCAAAENIATNMALNDLGLSQVVSSAAGEQEKQKSSNQQRMDKKKPDIEAGLAIPEDYKTKSEVYQVGHYDAFKISKEEDDFKANVKRLELKGICDEIIEMLNRIQYVQGQARRYRYFQRWRDHALRMPVGSSAESCFWAEVEELQLYMSTNSGAFENGFMVKQAMTCFWKAPPLPNGG